jgi:hypothetical protein
MNEPDFIAEYKAAQARGDDAGRRDVLRRAKEWREANPKPAPPPMPRHPDVAGALRRAREENSPERAQEIAIQAYRQHESHLLSPDDLVWIVGEVGGFKAGRRAGRAIAEWLYHHGPLHSELIAAAEEIASYDNTEWIDRVLLWVEPTPDRWFGHASWKTWWVASGLTSRLGCTWREYELHNPEVARLYKMCAAEEFSEHARRVIAERGSAARRSLRAAPSVAEANDALQTKLILEGWAEALS